MTRRVLAVLACAGAVLACSGGGSGGGNPAGTAKGWTVLVYMVADNDLESFAIPNLQQMAAVGSSDNLRIVVELDRSLRYSTSPIGNIAPSATTKRLLVQNGSFQQISDLGNLDTANPATLADFIQWGIRTYPAQNYALVLWDHGGGWKYGFGVDEPTGHILGLAQMQQALTSGLAAAGVSKLQILGFDACLMSTFEVMQALQPYATYLVASEETEPGAGWDYTRLVPARDSAAVEAVTLAKGIVDGYAALNASDPTLTLALTDLTKLSSIATAISDFAAQITPKLGTVGVQIARSRASALEFAKNPDPTKSYNMVDLGDLLRLLALADPTDFSALKAEFDTAAAGAVLYKKSGAAAATSTGISIFFPPNQGVYDAAAYGPVSFAAWRTFLEAYLAHGATALVPAFANAPASVTANADGTLTVSAAIAANASSIATASLLFGFSFPASPGVADEIDFYGSRPGSFDSTAASATWNRKLAQLTQGTTSDYAYLGVELRGGTTAAAVLPLAYLPPSATTCGSAGVGFATREIVFDTVSGQIASDSYFLSVGGTISELRPEIGSHFVPLVFVLVGTQNFTQPASANGWFCVGQPLAADQGIALAFQQPTLGPGLQLAFDLSIENAGGNGDEATAVGPF